MIGDDAKVIGNREKTVGMLLQAAGRDAQTIPWGRLSHAADPEGGDIQS